MIASSPTTDITWRLLWSHTARHVISDLPTNTTLEQVSAGYGWGLRRSDDPRRAILVHPTSNGRETGDLALTVLGQGTQVIPRAGISYPAYVDLVADAVEAAARYYLN